MSENFLPGVYTLPKVMLEEILALCNGVVQILSEKMFSSLQLACLEQCNTNHLYTWPPCIHGAL
jgi:hypothetical protein